MKPTTFALLCIVFTLNQIKSHAATFSNPAFNPSGLQSCHSIQPKGGEPNDIKIVVSQKRIWLLTDEMPMKCLKTQVKDATGKVVLEKCFTSKCSNWSLDIEALPRGEYTLYLGTDQIEKFKK